MKPFKGNIPMKIFLSLDKRKPVTRAAKKSRIFAFSYFICY